VRFKFIQEHKNEFPVEKMCKVMEVSASGYYSWQKRVPSNRKLYNKYLLTHIRQVYDISKRRYGSPRITKELKMQGIKASQPLIAKLMREENIRSIVKKKFKVTTDSSHNYPVAENKLKQEFSVSQSNRVWVSDLTYVHTGQGWIYLTTVIDLFDRKVIGWAMSETMKTKDTVIPAFRMAKLNRPIEAEQRLLFHSDRGVQYACEEFVTELSRHGTIERSMSRKGNCWDNAVAESFFKTLKAELVYQNRYQTKQQAMLSIFEYIETWYNQNRRHKHLNNLTITEFHRSINNLKNAA
jgi:putative transposase